MPNLISRRQYDDRRKYTAALCETIRKRVAENLDGREVIFIVDFKPVKACQQSRGSSNTMGKTCPEKAPDFGYCASQALYYFGYKLHAVCEISGVIHSYDLSKARVQDIKNLNDVEKDYFSCTVISDKAYLRAEIQYNLFESANIRLEVSSDTARRTGSLFTNPLQRQGRDWKRISRSSPTSSTSCATKPKTIGVSSRESSVR